METPAGICHGCQTLVDEMASATGGNLNHFEPTFLLTGSETTPCSLCSLLEKMANAYGYSASDECLRKAYTWFRGTILCRFPLNDIDLRFSQLSEYVKEHGESIGNARTASSCTGSLESLAFAKSKLDNCLQHHQNCVVYSKHGHQKGKWWPTRLLDLGISPTEQRIKLIDPPQNTADSYQYAALSYQWGVKPFMTLTADSERSFRAGIPLDELPATFRDAVSATRTLGLRYLWIDSLCIIQGSTTDWQREAPRMELVEWHPVVVNGCRGIFPKGGKPEHICTPQNSWFATVEGADLNRRGWVLQERLLAPRTLHFTTTQIFWECRKSLASEQFAYSVPLGKFYPGHIDMSLKASLQNLRKGNGSSDQAYALWYRILQLYSRMELTMDDDRLIAISGIAEVVKKALPKDEKYLAGLWQAHLPWNLLWRSWARHGPGPIQDRAKPSWSWASFAVAEGDGRRAMVDDSRLFDKRPQWAKAHVLDVNVTPVSNLFGSVREATLRIQARMCKARMVQPESDEDMTTLEIGGERVPDTFVFMSVHIAGLGDAVLLEIYVRDQRVPRNTDFEPAAEGLILFPAAKQGTYYRIGMYGVYYRLFGNNEDCQTGLEVLEQGFKSCNLATSQYQEFDGKERYVVEII